MKPILEYDLDLGDGRLWQIANRSRSQMMSYILDCPDGETIVIDGGMYCDEDADKLYSELEKAHSLEAEKQQKNNKVKNKIKKEIQ